MLAIGIDTSVMRGSVGLAGPREDASLKVAPVAPPFSETLLQVLQELLRGAGLSLGDIDLIAVATGPGTFTGLRIGMATARGLALALGRPVTGFQTLEMVARACVTGEENLLREGAAICVLQEAGRGEVYRGLYAVRGGDLAAILPEAILGPSHALDQVPPAAIICADLEGATVQQVRAAHGASWESWRPRPDIGSSLASRALRLARDHGVPGLPPPVPNYLRPSDAEVNFRA